MYNLQAEQVYLESDPEGELLDEHDAMKRFSEESGPEFWDGISGKSLPPNLVKTARREELEFMDLWHVWDQVQTSLCWQRSGKPPLGGRWVDTNKGDDAEPDVRCGWVAKDIAK